MDDAPDENLALKSESDGGNRARVKKLLSQTLHKKGAILPEAIVDALTDTALKEMADVRSRMAFMLHCFTEYFENEYTKDRLEKLELVFVTHLRDENNLAYMPPEMEDN